MERINLLWRVFFVAAVIALLHFLASKFFLYWDLWWFDILLHVLGGLWVFLAAVWFFWSAGFVGTKSGKVFILLSGTAAVLIVGMLWEIFELVAGLIYDEHFVLDTVTDIGSDLAGGFLGYLYFITRYTKKETWFRR